MPIPAVLEGLSLVEKLGIVGLNMIQKKRNMEAFFRVLYFETVENLECFSVIDRRGTQRIRDLENGDQRIGWIVRQLKTGALEALLLFDTESFTRIATLHDEAGKDDSEDESSLPTGKYQVLRYLFLKIRFLKALIGEDGLEDTEGFRLGLRLERIHEFLLKLHVWIKETPQVRKFVKNL